MDVCKYGHPKFILTETFAGSLSNRCYAFQEHNVSNVTVVLIHSTESFFLLFLEFQYNKNKKIATSENLFSKGMKKILKIQK